MTPIIKSINATTPRIIEVMVFHSLKNMTEIKVVPTSCKPVEIGMVLETPIRSTLLS